MKYPMTRRLLAALCALVLALGLLPAVPALAADDTLVLKDDFSSYKAGTDTFFNADPENYIYHENYHGAVGGESWATYGVVSEGDDPFLRLTAHNETANWFTSKKKVTGPFTLTMHVRFGGAQDADCTPSFILNPFQGNSMGTGKPVLIYLDPRYGVRIADAATTGSEVQTYMSDSEGSRFKPLYNTWYSVRVDAEAGRMTLKVWPRTEAEPTGTAYTAKWESDLLTGDVLARGNLIRFQNMARKKAGLATVTDVDNLALTAGTAQSVAADPAGGSGSAPSGDGTASAADPGKNEWVLFTDDFESYAVGQDTFFNAEPGLYTYLSGYHGSTEDAGWAAYGIAAENGGKALKLTSRNSVHNWLVTKRAVTGAYQMSLDVKLAAPAEGAKTPSFVVNLFQGNGFGTGKPALFYFDPLYGARMDDAASAAQSKLIYMTNGAGDRFKPAYDTWYALTFTVRAGSVTVTAAPKAGGEGAALTWECPVLTQSVLSGPSCVRLQNMARGVEGQDTVTLLDNLRLAKPYDEMTMPPVVYGVPGDTLDALPAFTGQDLSAQEPQPLYRYTLNDPGLGSVDPDGALLLGPGEGNTALTMELLDLRGAPSGAKCQTRLVVGSSFGLVPVPKRVKTPESDIGKTVQLALTYEPAVKAGYPSGREAWSSADPAVAAVDGQGLVTLTGFGSTVITVKLMDGETETGYFANIPVQVGETPLRILSIGNSYSRDSLYYLSSLARLAGLRIEADYLEKGSATMRHHARNVAQSRAEYSYWKSNPMTGEMSWQRTTTIQDAMSDGKFDVIMLHTGTDAAGMAGTFDSDYDFMLDYVRDAQPGAKIYWNMTWAHQQNVTGTRGTRLSTYYDKSQAVMYNAIVDCLGRFMVGKGARYADRIDGWFPTGAAIQSLRATYGDRLCRDGYHLSLAVGRLTAAMTVLKTLYPDTDLNLFTAQSVAPFLDLDRMDEGIKDDDETTYDNTEANMALVRAAVAAATKDLSRAPAKLSVPAPVRVESETKQGDFTIAQTTAPMKYHFPDVITLSDGTVLVSAYENAYHLPDGPEAYTVSAGTYGDTWGQVGAGRLLVWKSTDGGKTFDTEHPVLIVDQERAEAWGVDTVSGRYQRWKNGQSDYTFLIDPRDPNFAIVHADVTGDGKAEEVLLYNFSTRTYQESGSVYRVYMVQSIDGGKTWDHCQMIAGKTTSGLIKRGDIAAFSDGEILVPVYASNKIYLLRMKWDQAAQKWTLLAETVMKDFDPDKTGGGEFNEMSLVAPDPDSDVVYGYIRVNGTVVKSCDRGATWSLIGEEPMMIHQPGFALLDKERVFTTWARTTSPRTVYGKMFYVNGDWDDTETQTVYASPVTANHDMADPSAKLLPNGKILAVAYDTAYRSIVGTVVDPDAPEYRLPEMNRKAAEIVLYEDAAASGASAEIGTALPDRYVIRTTAAFTEGGELTVALTNGARAVFRAGRDGVEAGKSYHILVIAAGSAAYQKAWPVGTEEPDAWAGVSGGGATSFGKAAINGNGVTLNGVQAVRRVVLEMPEQFRVTAGIPALDPGAVLLPASAWDEAVWTSADPAVATVDKAGRITGRSMGVTTVTVNVGGATASTRVVVEPAPAELSGEGERRVLFTDDFEGYPVGENTFWDALETSGYKSNIAQRAENTAYNIREEDGNRFLWLEASQGKATWHKVDVPVVGGCTVQFDFYFTGPRVVKNATAPGHCLYINLWQDSELFYGFVHLTPEGVRVEYKPEGQTGAAQDPAAFSDEVQYELNRWHTIKIVRINGGLYVKVWVRGEAEPEEWTLVSIHPELDASQASTVRFQYYVSGGKPQQVAMDNLTVTQQVVKGAAAMQDVSAGDWFFRAVDWAIQNDVMSGYNAVTFGPNDNLNRAMLVQMLYNREGKPAVSGGSRFADVPDSQWYAAAVNWAAEKGVVSGYGSLYKPEQNITRQELAQMLCNYAGKPAAEADLSGFPDAGKIDGWAVNAMKWAVANGVMSGKGGGYLDPLGRATRAEAAQMLKNYLDR